MVTGATDGIGKEFALQLAKAGFNILLISRSEEKLKQMSVEIGKKLVRVSYLGLTCTPSHLFRLDILQGLEDLCY